MTIEAAWARVQAHSAAPTDAGAAAFRAAVRLTRWLATPAPAVPRAMAELVHRQSAEDAWVDSAVNDAAPGVGDVDLGRALELCCMPPVAVGPRTTASSLRR